MKIVITGSTGQIGSHLLPLLNPVEHEVVLITRNAEKLAAQAQRGATVLEGDMQDPTFMHAALTGADVLFFLPPPNFGSTDMIEEYRQLATVARDAVKAAGVQRVVHLSTLGAHLDRRDTGLIYGQHLAERIIAEAAPHVVHVRNGFFLENYLMAAGSIGQTGDIYFPVSGEARYSFVRTADIATVVSDLLEAPTWSGHSVVEFQGPRDYSFDEVAAEFGQGLGREVRHVEVPAAAAVEAMVGMGLSEAYATDLVQIFTAVEAGVLKAEFDRDDARVLSTGSTPGVFAQEVIAPLLG